MGVAQWADVPAFVLVGAVRFWLGCVATGVWERGGLGVRETRVKLGRRGLRLVKRQSDPPGRPPRPQRRNLATSSNITAPQPRGVARKPCPCLVRGYEPS